MGKLFSKLLKKKEPRKEEPQEKAQPAERRGEKILTAEGWNRRHGLSKRPTLKEEAPIDEGDEIV